MERTNQLTKWIAGLVALIIVLGCGGGGGGTSSGGGTGSGFAQGPLPAGQYLEFLKGSVKVDPLNLGVGDSVVVQYVNYDQFGTRTVLSLTNITLSGTGAGSAVTLTTQGLLQILSQPTGYLTITATATVIGQPKTLTINLNVSALGLPKVSGRLLANNSNVVVPYIHVEIIDNSGTVVGAALSDAQGRFTAYTLNSAAFLRFNPSSVPGAYFVAIKYQNTDYAATGTACLLPVPAGVGGTASYASDLKMPRQIDGPPPPPTGCN